MNKNNLLDLAVVYLINWGLDVVYKYCYLL